MKVTDIRTALSGDTKVDVVDFDMCLMGGYETLAVLNGAADYAVFSEEVVPGAGYPYTDVVKGLQQAAGADAVVALATEDDVPALARRFADACGGDVDLVLDPLCGAPASAAARVLASGGRLVNLGSAAGATATFDSAALRSRSAAILGYTNNDLTREQRQSALGEVLSSAAAGRLGVEHQVVHLDDVSEAWVRQSDGTAPVRIVVQL
jgi:NADPH:quinone reductase-like Zn-dependent oxidoreductase